MDVLEYLIPCTFVTSDNRHHPKVSNETQEDSSKVVRLCREQTGKVLYVAVSSGLIFVPYQLLKGDNTEVHQNVNMGYYNSIRGKSLQEHG